MRRILSVHFITMQTEEWNGKLGLYCQVTSWRLDCINAGKPCLQSLGNDLQVSVEKLKLAIQ